MGPVNSPTGLKQVFIGLSFIVAVSSNAQITQEPAKLYVNSLGNNRWAGTLERPNEARTNGPKRTLEAARDTIRQMRFNNLIPAEGLIVECRGKFELTSTLNFDHARDNGTVGGPIIWRGNGATISGGRSIRLWRNTPASELRVRSSVRSKVKVANLTQHRVGGFQDLVRRGFPYVTSTTHPELFYDGRRLKVAQYPNGDEWLEVASLGQNNTVHSDIPRLRNWRSIDTAWAYGFFGNNWADSYEKITAVDTENDVVQLANPTHYGVVNGGYFKFVNVLEELDRPGEYFIDRANMKVYLYPPDRSIGSKVVMSVLDGCLIQIFQRSNMVFEGFKLEHSRQNGIQVFSGNNIELRRLDISNVGRDGILIANSVNSGVIGCTIYQTGETGLTLGGGNRATLQPGNNYAINNYFYQNGEVVKTFRPAIRLEGVGNLVSNCKITNLPHMAIWINGNDHIIEKSVFRNVCNETDDAGAIYIGRNVTERGNIIRFNLFEDIARNRPMPSDNKVAGVYMDDISSGVLVQSNIFRRVDCGMIVGGGRDNTMINNIVEDARFAIAIDGRGLSWFSSLFAPNGHIATQLTLMNHTQPPYSTAYPKLADILNNSWDQPIGNEASRNVVIGGTMYQTHDGLIPASSQTSTTWLFDNSNYHGFDSGISGLGTNNLSLTPGGNAEAIGFTPWDTSTIGLVQNEHRPLLPADGGQ